MFEYSRWEEANTTLYKVEDWTSYYYVRYQELIPGSGLWTERMIPSSMKESLNGQSSPFRTRAGALGAT